MGRFSRHVGRKKFDEKLCSSCQKHPPRKEQSIIEIMAKHHFCDECWAEKLRQFEEKKYDIAKQAQAQYDKIMRDVKNGMDPLEAWDKKGEKDA